MKHSESQKIVFLWLPRWVVVGDSQQVRWLCRAMQSKTRWSTEYFSLPCWYNS
jgi:hypothetical protein